jgi:hypothetical protein
MIIIDTQHFVDRPMFYLAVVFQEKMDGAEKIKCPIVSFLLLRPVFTISM